MGTHMGLSHHCFSPLNYATYIFTAPDDLVLNIMLMNFSNIGEKLTQVTYSNVYNSLCTSISHAITKSTERIIQAM